MPAQIEPDEHHLHAGQACTWEDGTCAECGVGQSDPCEECRGVGYHELACSQVEQVELGP